MPAATIVMSDASSGGNADFVTLDNLRDEVKDCLGKDTTRFKKPLDTLINEWIAKLANVHSWQWREQSAYLSTVANQEYITLPTDFFSLSWLHVRATMTPVLSTSWNDLQRKRSSPGAVGNCGFEYCVRTAPQAAANVAPGYRLELWPTPNAANADYFTAAYRKLIPKLTQADHVPDIPAVHHPLIRQFVRMEAARYDDDSNRFMVEKGEFASMLVDHLAIDGHQQEQGGKIIGTTQRRGRYCVPHTGIGYTP